MSKLEQRSSATLKFGKNNIPVKELFFHFKRDYFCQVLKVYIAFSTFNL